MGITLLPIPEKENDKDHCGYTLPEGWRMVNTNPDGRQDMPEYHVLDSQNRMRVFISGHWRISYDNNLHLSIPEHQRIYTPAIDKIKSPEQRWKKYLQRYEKVVLLTENTCLLRQIHVDMVYEDLVTFCTEYPEFLSQLPKRHVVK